MHIGIIGAMDSEVAYLKEVLREKKEETRYGYIFDTGMIGTSTVTVVKCGIGKVNAARCTQMLIDLYTPDVIVNTGIAGAIAPELRIGDVVAAEGLVQHDFDLSVIGLPKGYMPGEEDRSKPTVFTCDRNLVSALEQAAEKIVPEANVVRGIIATGDVFVADAALKNEISTLYSAKAAEMEGGAVAQTAFYSGIPFAVMRVMSDQADGAAPESYDAFELRTAKQSAMIAEAFVRILEEGE